MTPRGNCLINERDAIDGECPQQFCPGTGSSPSCVDAAKLLAPLSSCKASHAFSIWRFGKEAQGAPRVIPPPVAVARTVTDNNRLVGAIVVTQQRKKRDACPRIRNKGVSCAMDEEGRFDGTPYGYDPTFMSFSSLYNGKLNPGTTDGGNYTESERNTSDNRNPIGFFPHGYLGNGESKPAQQIAAGAEQDFKLYFDERLTAKQALNMIQYCSTSLIKIEMLTFNAALNVFCMGWNYEMQSMSVDVYAGDNETWNLIQTFLVVTMLAVNTLVEIVEIGRAFRRFAFWDYFVQP
ncbi:hypothetical protein T484DRAFT_1849912 [Baffinella frigidus]|nr:hypothetical protein T484DRAFT_1849912 [Cryptophyta sp. CCMP2293]